MNNLWNIWHHQVRSSKVAEIVKGLEENHTNLTLLKEEFFIDEVRHSFICSQCIFNQFCPRSVSLRSSLQINLHTLTIRWQFHQNFTSRFDVLNRQEIIDNLQHGLDLSDHEVATRKQEGWSFTGLINWCNQLARAALQTVFLLNQFELP